MTMREVDALMDRFRESEAMAFLRAGTIASVIANCHRVHADNPTPYTPQDFMPPSMRIPEREKTVEDLEAAWLDDMRVLVAKTGGKDMTSA